MSRAKILELACKVLLTTVLIYTVIAPAYSQERNNVKLLEFRYGFHWPAGDLKDRFGAFNDFGVNLEVVGLKNKLFIGADGSFLFGNTVKEDVLEGLRTFDGTVIGFDGSPADINLKARGFYIGVNTGKIFPMSKNENNLTGIRAQIGAGLLQHKIRVQDNLKSVIALRKDNLQGYDRLTNGPAVHLALGFQYQNPKSNFHFSIMGDVYGAQTKSRRDFDNLTGGYLSEKRTDLLAGVSIAYIVSISRNTNPDHIYY
jgi:hypothetical protein